MLEPRKRVLRSAFALCLCVILFSVSFLFITNVTGCRMINQEDTHFPMEEITVSQLLQWQESAMQLVIIDARADHFFNGWPAGEGIKQGHIKNAVSFQPHWLELAGSPADQYQLLMEKGINRNKTLVIYDQNDGDASTLYQGLKRLGYTEVYRLTGGIQAWGDAGNETAILPKYHKLVYPHWLKQQRDIKQEQALVILEVGYDEQSEYGSGHIPGAIYLDTREIEWNQGTPSWNFIPDNRLVKVLTQYGIDRNTMVVVYADERAMGAYRAAVALLYAGVNDVRVLNGGKRAWKDQGYNLETTVNSPVPKVHTTLQVPESDDLVINIPEIKALMNDSDSILASVMTPEEFNGEKSGYFRYSKAGHIPGSVLLENGDSAYDMLNYQDIDGTMRSWTEIEKMWQEKGITADKEVSFYCGTGWRASEAFFAAYLMGWKQISVFDDGWIGWSMDPANPVAPEG